MPHTTHTGNREYILVTEPATQFPVILTEIQAQPNISIDTETTSIDIPTFSREARLFGISIAVTPERAYYLPVAHEGSYQQFSNLNKPQVAAFMAQVFQSGVPVVYHNASYDRSVLAQHLGLSPELTSNYHDTVLMAHLMDENQPLGLKSQAIRYLGVQPEVTKIDDDLDNYFFGLLQVEERMAPNKAGRLYKKKFYAPVPDWTAQALSKFIALAGGAASYKVTLGYAQKFWSVFKKHAVEGYEELPKPFDFRYVPIEIANIYASDDVMNTLALFRLWRATYFDLNEHHWELYKNIELSSDDIMTRSTIRGTLVDREYLLNMQKILGERIHTAREEGLEAAKHLIPEDNTDFNTETLLTSSKQLGSLLFDVLGYPVLSKTEKGAPQVTKSILDKLLKEKPKKRPELIEYSKSLLQAKLKIADLEKISGTYVEGILALMDNQDRIHPTYNIAGTVSGRMSSSRPNFQNMARLSEEELTERPWLHGVDIRAAFISDPDYVFCSADFSAMEVCVAAAFSQDANLMALLKEGRDMHSYTARHAFEVGHELDDKEFKKQYKHYRQLGKIANFAMMYRGTRFTLMKSFNFSEQDADAAVKGFDSAYPALSVYFNKLEKELRTKGYFEYPEFPYRKRLDAPPKMLEFTDFRAYNRQMSAAIRSSSNAAIQGWSAMYAKDCVVRIQKQLHAEGLDAQVLYQIHDDIGVLAHRSVAERVQQIMVSNMERELMGVQLKVEPEIKTDMSKNSDVVDLDDLNLQAELLNLHLEMQL